MFTKVSERQYKRIETTSRRKSNGQYKPKVTIGGMCGAFVLLLGLSLTAAHYSIVGVNGLLHPDIKIVSPIAKEAYADVIPTITEAPSEKDLIKAEVKTVFGKDADKAFKLLSCENGRLNPKAKNINTDEYQSIDWGIFQINNHWQGVTNAAFLTDYKINIRMAYNIYSRDGNSFKLWSCSKKVGLN